MDRQKITPYLWFDKEALEAAELYTTTFGNSKILSKSSLENTPSGKVDMATILIEGQEFGMISAGPLFKINPSISFMVNCESEEELDRLWKKLLDNGEALMEIGKYPFAEKYGWLQDKFGVSWQLIYRGKEKFSQKIVLTLMFVGGVCGKAREAISLYAATFPKSAIGDMMTYGAGEEPDREGTIKHASFTLAGVELAAMDSAHDHKFGFNEGVSLVVHCENQAEIDEYWENLSAVPEAEQCGWLKDKYGVSWQIVPNAMDRMMGSGNQSKIAKVTEAFLKMKKFDVAELERVYNES
ncbi:MAG: VOC family protein [Candidatus Shapirobacteria bacterium]|jgi:predicted 3-demethylubiquinone-9 3-methyltransferase (glyoxalase superfamily)